MTAETRGRFEQEMQQQQQTEFLKITLVFLMCSQRQKMPGKSGRFCDSQFLVFQGLQRLLLPFHSATPEVCFEV